MEGTSTPAFDMLLAELRAVGAGDLADTLEKLGPAETRGRLHAGVNALCRKLPCALHAAESLRRYRDSRG